MKGMQAMATKKDNEGSGVHKVFTRVRDYVMFGTFVCAVLGGVVAGYVDVQGRLNHVEEDVREAKNVHRYLILQAQHMNKTIRHIVPAERRDELPAPPPELRAAELDLLP
jgi:hypothetical protein